MELKICGIQPGDDLAFTKEPEVSHVGVVFCHTSRRYVAPHDARAIHQQLDGSCRMMGVFVNASTDEILQDLDASGASGAQLHGSESPAQCRTLRKAGFTVWKAIPVQEDHPAVVLQHLQRTRDDFHDCVDAFLLDAAPPKGSTVTGGFGRAFDWLTLRELTKNPDVFDGVPVWVAGGIAPANVRNLLGVFSPKGMDVSSGVERNGRKAMPSILAMIEAVREYETAHCST